MNETIRLPKMDLAMEEGRLVKWHVGTGASLVKGDVIAEIETDKAIVELEMPQDGVIAAILAEEGETLAVGQPIAELAAAGSAASGGSAEPAPAIAAASIAAATTVAPSAAVAVQSAQAHADPMSATSSASTASTQHAALNAGKAANAAAAGQSPGARVAASPAARRRSRELGVDYATLTGTGPRGRVLVQDIELAASRLSATKATAERSLSAPTPVAVTAGTAVTSPNRATAPEGSVILPLSGMRRTIARRMVESVTTIPQFALKAAADISAPMRLKAVIDPSLAGRGFKLSLTDFIVAATARALRKHPALNASFVGSPFEEDSHILRHGAVNIGMAVAADRGLLVPVLHNADQLSLVEIAKLRVARVEAAKRQALKPDEMRGGTFTISNLGLFGIEEFQAIVNPPEAGILAIGAAKETPRLIDGKLEFRPILTLTGTFDHRVVDGADAAAFLRSIADQLESDQWQLI